jgi:hypothetical protein
MLVSLASSSSSLARQVAVWASNLVLMSRLVVAEITSSPQRLQTTEPSFTAAKCGYVDEQIRRFIGQLLVRGGASVAL